MKLCLSCRRLKPHKDFYKNSCRPDGHESSCKDCDILRRIGIRKSFYQILEDRGLERLWKSTVYPQGTIVKY
jgi:hypothetical protein